MSGLLCLPVEDILIPHVLSLLTPIQIWSLRSACKDLHRIVEQYFTVCVSTTFRISHSGHLYVACHVLFKCRRLRALSIEIDALLQEQPIDRCLRSLAIASPRLKFLALSRCHTADPSVCADSLSECCQELSVLRLRSLSGPSQDWFLGSILRKCTFLCELELVDQPGIGESLLAVISNSPCLCRLTLHNTGGSLRTGQLEEAMKDAGCRQLCRVSLRFMGCVSDRTIRILTEFCPSLTSLEVLHCPLVSHAVLQRLALQRQDILLLSDVGECDVHPTSQFARYQI